jgi:hypothetical protein
MLGYIISDKNEINIEKYKIKRFDILHKTDLNIFVIRNNVVLYMNNIINNASRYGHIQVLEWFKNSGYEVKYFYYFNYAINNASRNGHIKVLEWFKNSGYEFKYGENAIDYASEKGYVKVLEWFKNSGYEFKYNVCAINYASARGHIEVLEWFKNSEYKFKYNKNAFQTKVIRILKFHSNNFNIKKLIKWSTNIFIKTIKFKTNSKYLKGYQKN